MESHQEAEAGGNGSYDKVEELAASQTMTGTRVENMKIKESEQYRNSQESLNELSEQQARQAPLHEQGAKEGMGSSQFNMQDSFKDLQKGQSNDQSMKQHMQYGSSNSQFQSQSQRLGGAIAMQDGVIDLESENLTYTQAKSIRFQVQKDCELLRNRVRMLQNEMERAKKKITETRQKTLEIRQLKKTNDDKIMQRVSLQRIKEEAQGPNSEFVMKRQALKETIQEKKQKIWMDKQRMGETFREEQNRNKYILQQYREEYQIQNYEKQQKMRKAMEAGNKKKNDFYELKRNKAKRETDNIMDTERSTIQQFEQEAENLEALEADLLARLQETQKKERDAFGKLENIMIDTSIPKRQRVRANGSIASFVGAEQSVHASQTYQSHGRNNSTQHYNTAVTPGNPNYDPFDTYGAHLKKKS